MVVDVGLLLNNLLEIFLSFFLFMNFCCFFLNSL